MHSVRKKAEVDAHTNDAPQDGDCWPQQEMEKDGQSDQLIQSEVSSLGVYHFEGIGVSEPT
jgi:hypothetical protein